MTKFSETTDAAGSSATIYTLGAGDFVQGTISSAASDFDWYKVNLVAGQTYTFAATGIGVNNLQNIWLELKDAAGASLQIGTALPGNNSILTFTATASGIYYIDVEDLDFVTSGSAYELSVTTGTKGNFDVDMTAGVIDTDVSWSTTPGTGAVVTYSFRDTLPAGYTVSGSDLTTFAQASAAQIAAIESILALYSEMTGITFQRVAPGGYSNSAQMVFGNYNDPDDGAGAFAFYPGGGSGSLDYGGDVWMNTSVSRTSLPVGSYSWFAVMHEIGHALGLSHPGMYNAAPGVNITYANNAQFIQDSGQYTVMSYFDETNTGANAGGYQDTPMIGDILALQNIYGANLTTRTGNTTYGFNNNTGNAIYAFAVGGTPSYAIWDAGGIDTIDASGFSNTQTIRLGAAEFSSIGGLVSNISIAANVVVENAIGGSGSDTIIGNSAANTLNGGAGADSLDGGTGTDTLIGGIGGDGLTGGSGNDRSVYSAASGSATWRYNADGSWTVSAGADGTDTLRGVETVQFSERELRLWRLEGEELAGDFNGDGRDDVLLRSASGEVQTWLMAANGTVSSTVSGPAQLYDWSAAGVGDFNGNGTDDILWRNDTTGQVQIWSTSGGVTSVAATLNAGIDWHLHAVADFNGDGVDDILWRNANNDALATWQMSNFAVAGGAAVAQVTGTWRLLGTADFDGDLKSDYLWYNSANNALSMWSAAPGGGGILGVLDSSWSVQGLADFNGDGRADILWRHTSGALAQWQMGPNGTSAVFNSTNSDWQIQDVGFYNGDAKADILWRQTSTGAVGLWTMDGLTVTGSTILQVPSTDWVIL